MGFLLKTCIFLLTTGVLLVVVYDVNINGNLQQSNSVQFLRKIGVLHYSNLIHEQSVQILGNSYKWAQSNVPLYYTEACHCLKPYLQLLYDLSLVASNVSKKIYIQLQHYIADKSPIVDEWVTSNIPQVKDVCRQTWITAKNGYATVTDAVCEYANAFMDYSKKHIFVGNISPENLHRYTLEALNTTQTYATTTMHWVYEKLSWLQE